jgi:transcriptional regulator with XRE-family HTH domain
MRIALQYWRQRRLLSQMELAQRAGVNVLTIRRIEHGAGAQGRTLRKLAEALAIPPDCLVERDAAELAAAAPELPSGAPGRWIGTRHSLRRWPVSEPPRRQAAEG